MDRSREARSSSNGTSRRRSRATTFRDLPEERQVELQETVRLKDRASKRDRDRDFASRSIRRRGSSNREEKVEEDGDTSGEDNIADRDSDEVGDGGGVSRILSSTTASSASNQNQRRNSLPPRVAKQQWKVVDDAMIGVPVPRKARSASVKRSHDCTVSGNSGVGGAGEDIADDQSHRNPLDSPARSSAEVVSPSNSIIPIKKMKPGPKTRKPKMSKGSSPSAKDGDIEIEIAEVLFGLLRQSQCSKKQEVNGKPSTNQETEDTKPSVASITANSAQTAFQQSVLRQNNGAVSDLLFAVEKNKVIHDSSSPLTQNNSSEDAAKGESEQPAEMKICLPKLEAAFDFDVNSSFHKCGTEVTKPDERIARKDVSTGGDEITGSKKIVLTEEELHPSSNMDVDLEDSVPTKSITEAVIKKEEKFKFDLMAPPTSPERNGFTDIVSDSRSLSLEVEMGKEISDQIENKVEGFKEKETAIDEVEDKVVKSGKKLEFFKLDLEKPHLDSGTNLQEQSQKQQSKGTAGTVESNETSTSVRLPISLGGWPTAEIPTVGCMPPFQTIVPMDKVDISSPKLQHPNFILSHPRPKRCLTHYDIARNIYLHQQFTKTNYSQPAADASASHEANLKNLSSEGSIRTCFDANLNGLQKSDQATVDFPGSGVSDKSPEAAKSIDMARRKQLVLTQAQGTSFGNSLSGPGFIFPISQHQAPIAATGNQSGSTKSSNSSASLLNNQEAGKLESFRGQPAVSSNISYSHPGQVSIEAPYFAKLQNNGYAFTFSTPAGTATYRANSAQALPLSNGSFFSPQLFHTSQVQPAQSLSQTQSHIVQSTHQSSGSLPHKQPQTQQQKWSVHVPGNNLVPSNGVQSKQSIEQHFPSSNLSCKQDGETSGEDTTTSVSGTRTPQSQKTLYGQNIMLPVQALNFTLMPSAALSNGNSGNHGDKKQSHPHNLKSTVSVVPSQALTMSFASFNGNGTQSTLNFTPAAQSTAVFQSLPNIQRAGFQVAPAPQSTKQKNHQTSEGRNGGILSNSSDKNTGNSGKASATSGQTLVFSNSARTLNFMSSPVPGSWPPPSIRSTPLTTNRPAVGPTGSQQQQQLLQLQRQQLIMLQPQATMVPQTKVPTNNVLPSSVPTKFSYNAPGFSQSLVQCDNSIQSPLKNSGTMVASVVPMTSLHLASSTATHKKGQTQISFGGDFKPTFSQMQQIPSTSHSPSALVTGSPSSGGKSRNNTAGSKTGSSVATMQSKQDENSSTGTGQKSSPVCAVQKHLTSSSVETPIHLQQMML